MCNFPSCTRPTPAGKEYCFMHNAKYGTIKIKNSDNSADRAEQEKEYKKLSKTFLKTNPICEVKDCGKPSSDTHHRAGRIGNLLTDTALFMAVCRKHHKQITDNSKWAIQEGYSLSRLNQPLKK